MFKTQLIFAGLSGLLTAAGFACLSGCSSGGKAVEAKAKDGWLAAAATPPSQGPGLAAPANASRTDSLVAKKGGALAAPMTSSGENWQPAFSPDGKRILFLSRSRSAHKNTQIYELDLKTKLERRTTYHDGEDADPTYSPDGTRVLYASTTDEIKEDPNSLKALRERLGAAPRAIGALPELSNVKEPFELYLASLDGSWIRRLTNSAGYDAEAKFSADGKRVAFASTRSTRANRTQIYLASLDAKGASQNAISLAPGPDDDGEPSFSPDGKQIVFVRRAPDSAVSHVFLLDLAAGARSHVRPARQLTHAPALNLWPIWSPSGKEIVFASNRSDGASFDLWAAAVDGSCVRRLTDAPEDELRPALSPDGTKLAFDWGKAGYKQIYWMPFAPLSKPQSADCDPAGL